MPLRIILYSKPPTSFMHRGSEEKRKLCDNESYYHTIASACPAREAWKGGNWEGCVFFFSSPRPVILELKELCSPQTCFLHTQQYWGTQAWLERTGWSTIASRVFRIRHMRQHPGRDIGPLGSDWQQEPTWLTSSTPDDREVQPDKAVFMLPTWQPAIIIHSSQSGACTLSISTWDWRKSLFSWTWPFPVQWSDGQPSRHESLVDK